MLRPAVSAAVLLVAALVASAFDEPSAPVIEEIEILVRDVFDEGEDGPEFWAYRLANRLHVDTREKVVRQELLFQTGDPLDREVLAQTERNLRALPFLRDARVEALPGSGAGRVRVRVETKDSWTTVPEVRLAKVGNEWVWGLGFSERNLFGLGKGLHVMRDSGIDRDETFGLYRDPRLFGSRFALGTLLADASDGHRASVAATRPFFALETAWSLRMFYEDFERIDPLYREGVRVEELRHRGRLGEIGAAYAVRRSAASALRLHASYVRSDHDVSVERRRFGILQLGISSVTHRFLKMTHLNRFERPEDINLGNESAAFVGISTPELGGEDGTSYFFFLSEGLGAPLGAGGFLLGRASWQARHRHGRIENSLARARLHVVKKLSDRKVVLGKADLHYGTRLDPEIQVRLGAGSGLRGYPVRQFNGDRSLLLTAEGRWFLADDVAQLVSIGVAAFAETGYAWPSGVPMSLGDLRSDVGVSLLLGGNRVSASRPGMRIDLAYALSPVDGRGPWLLSAGSQLEF